MRNFGNTNSLSLSSTSPSTTNVFLHIFGIIYPGNFNDRFDKCSMILLDSAM